MAKFPILVYVFCSHCCFAEMSYRCNNNNTDTYLSCRQECYFSHLKATSWILVHGVANDLLYHNRKKNNTIICDTIQMASWMANRTLGNLLNKRCLPESEFVSCTCISFQSHPTPLNLYFLHCPNYDHREGAGVLIVCGVLCIKT